MKKLILLFCFVISVSIMNGQNLNLVKYVDPFIGTAGHGHTFPGACVPFGFVQLSPETGTKGWDWCSGYHSSDNSIMGFSHTHLSGTGGADLGDILFMPYTGNWKLEPGTKKNPGKGYRSLFSHSDEKASAGFYSVKLKSYNINVELTATKHCGFHKYTFPKSDRSDIIIDLTHGIGNKTKDSWIEKVGNNAIKGFRRSHGWAPDRYIYFYAKFSKPFEKFAIAVNDTIYNSKTKAEGKNVKALIRYHTNAEEVVYVKVGLSAVSTANAKENLNTEIPNWNFAKIHKLASDSWEKEIDKVVVEGGTESQKRTFYTALYHAFLVPYFYTDVNRQYRGMDNKIHTAQNFDYYTLFSLWDTFRAAHPLYSILEPKRNIDFVKSLLVKYDEAGHLPVWELHSNETWCMIGNHSIPVITDAYLKGYGKFDIQKAFKAMKAAADDSIRGLKYYKKYGYIPYDKDNNSVSVTLEYAYDDWCIAQVAEKLGYKEDYNRFIKRAAYYKNVFDTKIGFVRGKDSNGKWRPRFDPMGVSIWGKGDFTEGNSWQYSFFAPQDVDGLIKLFGGNKKFSDKLDSLFNQPSVVDNKNSPDVSGLIGQYAQGNEPSHHVAYLYDYAGEAYKTQSKVREIMDKLYNDKRDGLCGNEDCGQMSAWYVFSALGFYPVNPADGNYAIGSPLFNKVNFNLPNGKKFVIEAKGNSDKNKYIQSADFLRKDFNRSFITHKEIENGGTLVFQMGNKPSHWGCKVSDRPVSKIN